MDLKYSDGIAAERTLIAVEANAAALQRRLPAGWELAPYAGDDLRGTSLRGANMLLPFHEVYALRSQNGQPAGLSQVSYVAFISQARNQATGALGHFHWFLYTEEQRGETQVRESFSAVADDGEIKLSVTYLQGGMVAWSTAEKPNLPLYAAKDPSIVRWYQEDQVINIVRSDPLKINAVSEMSLKVQGELSDVFDGNERVLAVVIQRPYMRQVFV